MMDMKLPVEVAVPTIRDILLTNEYPGYLQAINTVTLVARVSGKLEQIAYVPGAHVKKGQLLFVIEPTNYQDNVSQAQAALKEGKANLAYAQATYERTKEAAKANAVSEIQVIQTQSNYEQAVAAIHNYEAQLQTAQTNLSYCYVKAPFNGRVSKNNYDVGNFLNSAQSPTLATLYQDDSIYVNFSVSDNQYLNIEVQRDNPQSLAVLGNLTVIPDAQENLPSYKARLTYFAPNVDISTGTINLRGIIDNKAGLLRDGMYVKVVMPYKKQKDAVLIPDASIGTDQVGRYVYVVNDSSKVVLRRIEVGQLIDEDMRLVVSGLSANDKFITQALLKVRPGMTVNPVMKPLPKSAVEDDKHVSDQTMTESDNQNSKVNVPTESQTKSVQSAKKVKNHSSQPVKKPAEKKAEMPVEKPTQSTDTMNTNCRNYKSR